MFRESLIGTPFLFSFILNVISCRAVIPENNIRPIDATEKSLNVKKTGGKITRINTLIKYEKFLFQWKMYLAGKLISYSKFI